MSACKFSEASPFYCEAHGCGVAADGAIVTCNGKGCPHCGKGGIDTGRTLQRLARAQRRLEEWEKKLARAATTVVTLRAEVRRHWKRLEQAGLHVDPMQLKDEAKDD